MKLKQLKDKNFNLNTKKFTQGKTEQIQNANGRHQAKHTFELDSNTLTYN